MSSSACSPAVTAVHSTCPSSSTLSPRPFPAPSTPKYVQPPPTSSASQTPATSSPHHFKSPLVTAAQHNDRKRPSPASPRARTRPHTPPHPSFSSSSSPTSPSKRQRHSAPQPKILPRNYAQCPPIDLCLLISSLLLELVSLNDPLPLSSTGLTRFHSRAPPAISIPDYLHRLQHHAQLQPSILLTMVYYIDILSTHYPPFVVSSLTVHRFLITAATVACKGLCDVFFTNKIYAKIGGVKVGELNMLELEFLVRVGWRIVPRHEVLEEYYGSLVEREAGRYRLEPEAPGRPLAPPGDEAADDEEVTDGEDGGEGAGGNAGRGANPGAQEGPGE